jgi:hypothetical protein
MLPSQKYFPVGLSPQLFSYSIKMHVGVNMW